MTAGGHTIEMPAADERIYVASQWKLVWWRFRRHRLGMVGTAIILVLYLVALVPGFLAIHDPIQSNSKRLFLPPQRIHFFDNWKPLPYVYGIQGTRDPVTLKMNWEADTSKKYRIRYFVHGHEYKLLGLITTDIHFLGLDADEAMFPLHPLGTDRMGRDMWSRLMYGTRISMSIGLAGVMISLFLGVLLGGLSGLRGGLTDGIIQRFVEFLRSMPTIPIWMALSASVPQTWSVVKVYFAITIILSLLGWTTLAREVRGRFLALRDEDFVIAARLYGAGQLRLIFRHMVPSFISHIIAATTLAVPAMIIAETSLSFLGLGMRQPAISWGVLLREAQNLQSVALAPWLLIPGALVIVSILSFNFMGDGLRDAADPYAGR